MKTTSSPWGLSLTFPSKEERDECIRGMRLYPLIESFLFDYEMELRKIYKYEDYSSLNIDASLINEKSKPEDCYHVLIDALREMYFKLKNEHELNID